MALDERALSHRAGAASRDTAVLDLERGKNRLQKWKSQLPFDSATFFQQRLQQGSLSESDLLELLSRRSIPSRAPAWAIEIAHALSGQPDAEQQLDLEKLSECPEVGFLELIRPLIARALEGLREGVKALADSPMVSFDPSTVEGIFLRLLPGRLLPVLARTMALELNVARLRGLLEGQTAEERFASFIRRLRQPEVRVEILQEYPVLARQVATILENWSACCLEFLQRWCADWPVIQAAFTAQELGPLVRIQSDAGDRHRRGRAVWIVECRSGFKVVYKPKSMAVDRRFQELLRWLNERGFAAPFRQLNILERREYGWEEFVCPQSCSCAEEVGRFYQRTGGYLALLYALGATDFHHENLLAAGEQPMLIDLEALFHPASLEPEPRQADDIAARSLRESVLGVTLLPAPVWNGREEGAFDFSGLGAEPGQKLPGRGPGWEGAGTDKMHFVRQARALESSTHRPTLNGAQTRPLDYFDAIEAGFRQVYGLLDKHRDELLAPDGLLARFAEDEVRVVLRNTARYAELLQEGSHPDVLRDGLERDRLFDRLWEEVKDRPHLAWFIPAETQDLWQGNIPLFTTRPGSRDLWDSAGRRLPGVLNESGLERARVRLQCFGPEDLKRQLWLLRGSLTTLSVAQTTLRSRRPLQVEPRTSCDRAQLVAAACAVGDRLAETAVRGAGDATWIGLAMMQQEKWILAPVGLDLYDGLPGIVLFLAYLGKVSGEHRYTTLAQEGFETVRRLLAPDKRKHALEGIGGFSGYGGLIYALTHLGVLWSEPALLAQAQGLVEELPDKVAKDNELDFIGGAAGCIAGLLCLEACRPSARTMEVAVQCGDHLLARARQMPEGLAWDPSFPSTGPLTGFSHGAAGISLALLELANRSGKRRFRNAALSGLAYERGLFCAKAGNWPDLRAFDTKPGPAQTEVPSFQVMWCHGAPGIGLARLLCKRLLDDPLLDGEMETAARTTLASGFGSNHSLCHGDLGNLELLLQTAEAFPGSAWRAEANRLTAGIVNSIAREGWLCGNPLAVESPGLMTGLAGIGYGLLRCAEPVKVPSVLSLGAPVVALRRLGLAEADALRQAGADLDTPALEATLAADFRCNGYRLESVYLRLTEAQRAEVLTLWHNEGVLCSPSGAERFSREAGFLVRACSGELAGVCVLPLVQTEDGRIFYDFGLFLRKQDRVPNLLVKIVVAARNFLRVFQHSQFRPAGVLHVNDNPKLMRPGARDLLARCGYCFWGKTSSGEEVWALEFAPR
jgi:type 2 lantibiotic biosynthesis protein LanM